MNPDDPRAALLDRLLRRAGRHDLIDHWRKGAAS